MSRKKQERPSADDRLASENFPGLNEAIYKTEPHGYLLQRWHHLLLARAAGDKLDDLLRGGLEADGFEYRNELEGESKQDMEDDRRRFVIAESEVLLHHVSETLLRLYIAHRGRPSPPCPWLELVRVRNPGDFKRSVERLRKQLPSDDERDMIRLLFYGTTKREAFSENPPDEAWIGGPETIAKYLDHFARVFLSPDSYNAAKHGLAMVTGESALSLRPNTETGEPDKESEISTSGPAIEFLTIDRSKGKPLWGRKTKWINLNLSVSLIWIGCRLINGLWETARFRYTKESPDGIRFFYKPNYEEVMKSSRDENPIQIEEMTMHLLYYEEPEDQTEQ